jgi:hypothetical protein
MILSDGRSFSDMIEEHGDTARQQHPDSPPDLVPDHRRRHPDPGAHHRRGTRLRLHAHGPRPRDTGHRGDHSPAGMARLLSV